MAKQCIVRAWVAALLTGADAAFDCSGAYKLINTSSSTYCGSGCSQQSCCEKDDTKCGYNTSLTCDDGKVIDDAKTGDTKDVCCVAKATCTTLECKDGYKKKASPSDCGVQCAHHSCCEADSEKCASFSGCAADQIKKSDGTTGSTADKCCETAPKCADHTCGTYYTEDPDKANTTGSSDYVCCAKNMEYCGHNSIACDDGKKVDQPKKGTTKEACCTLTDDTCDTYSSQEQAAGKAAASTSDAASASHYNRLLALSMHAFVYVVLA